MTSLEWSKPQHDAMLIKMVLVLILYQDVGKIMTSELRVDDLNSEIASRDLDNILEIGKMIWTRCFKR